MRERPEQIFCKVDLNFYRTPGSDSPILLEALILA